MKRLIVILMVLSSVATLKATEIYKINNNWKFFKHSEREAILVNLPHMWNSDALAGEREYYRGVGNYMKYLNIKSDWRHKRIFIKFYGANLVTDLFLNGKLVGGHKGGSNAFIFEITDFIDFNNKNLIWVVVNNGARMDVLPINGSENCYGGIYRDVELIVTNSTTVGKDNYASNGVFVRPTKVSAKKAEGSVLVKVNSLASKQVKVDMSIADREGNIVRSASLRSKVEKGVTDVSIPFEVDSPILWDGLKNPYLYNINITLTDGNNSENVSLRSGFRYFEADSKKGFSLNGSSYPLRGVVLSRDRAMRGSVSTEDDLRNDLSILREMGANAVYVTGGAHSSDFYSICDEKGIVVLTEIPFLGALTLYTTGYCNTPEFKANAKNQLNELIWQQYNHPSIVAWGIFNSPELRGDNPIPLIKDMNGMAKSLDPFRFTFGRSNRDGELNLITDLIVWNHTLGWAEGFPADIAVWCEQFLGDKSWNKIRSAVSYEAGGVISQQSETLQKPNVNSNWHPENWHTVFHETYIQVLNKYPQFWGLFPANLFDSGSVDYVWGSGSGVDDFGLVTFDRASKKDAFYIYKANWNKEEPFVHIVGRRNNPREKNIQNIKVYSNCEEVSLIINGEALEIKKSSSGVFTWNMATLKDEDNTVEAVGYEVCDVVTPTDTVVVSVESNVSEDYLNANEKTDNKNSMVSSELTNNSALVEGEASFEAKINTGSESVEKNDSGEADEKNIAKGEEVEYNVEINNEKRGNDINSSSHANTTDNLEKSNNLPETANDSTQQTNQIKRKVICNDTITIAVSAPI